MPSLNEHISRLTSSTFFAGLSPSTIDLLAKKIKLEEHKAGTVLMNMNSIGDKVYIVEKGRVRVSRVTSYGRKQR